MSSSSTASSTSASLLTSSRLRLSGTDLISGLDTDSIIKKLVAGTQSKIDSKTQKKQLAEWKQEAYRDIISQLQTFSNTYFSYTNNSTNLLSPSFFDLASITSSSSLVSATGSVSNAQGMSIQSISQLASKASYVSKQKVTDEQISSGTIQSEWTKSNVGGKMLVLSYEGKNYDIRLGGDLQFNSADSSEDRVQMLVDELNKQIGATDGLNGKVSFAKNMDGSITLKTTDSSQSVQISSYQPSDSTDTSGKKFLSALGFTDGAFGASVTGSVVDTSTSTYLFNKTVDADSELKLKVNDNDYTLTLGSDYDISDGTPDSIAKNIASLLQKQVDANSDLKGKVTVSTNGDKVSLQAMSGASIAVTGGSQNLLKGLGLTAGGSPSTEISGTGINESALTTSYLPDTLSGNSITFDLDGLTKTISFDANDLQTGEDFNSATGIAAYLKRKLNSAFGSGKVSISDGTDGKLVFTAGDNSVLTLTSSDNANVLSSSGALRIDSGETNRAELTKTLGEVSSELKLPLETGSGDYADKYAITVNGKEFTFSKDDTLGQVLTKINNDEDANVTVSYSQTTDTFRVTYDETGSQGKTDIADQLNGGNLAEVLFGNNYVKSLRDQVDADPTLGSTALAALNSSETTGITANKDNDGNIQSYSVTGTGLSFSGDTTLNDALSRFSTSLQGSTETDGQDLKMSMILNGTKTDITRSSNATTIDGVTLTVSGKTTDDSGNVIDNANITFSADGSTDDLYKKITGFVDAYNKIISNINTAITTKSDSDYPPLTDSQKENMSDSEITKWEDKAKQGVLQNDSTLSSILSNLRDAMTGIVDSTKSSLNSIGISTIAYDYTSGGQLTVNSDALKKAISENPNKISSMFTGEDGISQRVKKVLDKNVGTFGGDGTLLLMAGSDSRATDTSELGTQITDYKNIISNLKDELTTEEDRYWDQFTSMEQSLSVLMSQSSYFTSMLGGSSSS